MQLVLLMHQRRPNIPDVEISWTVRQTSYTRRLNHPFYTISIVYSKLWSPFSNLTWFWGKLYVNSIISACSTRWVYSRWRHPPTWARPPPSPPPRSAPLYTMPWTRIDPSGLRKVKKKKKFTREKRLIVSCFSCETFSNWMQKIGEICYESFSIPCISLD